MTKALTEHHSPSAVKTRSPNKRLRFAWICPFTPGLGFGGTVRTYHLLKAAAERHDIDAFILADSEDMPGVLQQKLRAVRFLPPDYGWDRAKRQWLVSRSSHQMLATQSRAVERFAASVSNPYDVVVYEYTRSSAIEFPAAQVRVLNMHNIEHELLERSAQTDHSPLRRFYRQIDARRLRREEKDAVATFDLVGTCSAREAGIVRSWPGAPQVKCYANGVDTEYFDRPLSEQERYEADLVFIGTMNYFPNEQAVLEFHAKIWPLIKKQRPETTCRIVGVNPTDAIRALNAWDFKVVGKVADIRASYWRSRILIAPLLSGSGTRIKILEAAGAGTPVVSTTVGAEGIDFEHDTHLLLADKPQDFAKACLDLLINPLKGLRLAQNARQRVGELYEWRTIGNRLCDDIEAAVEQARKDAP